MSSIPNKFWIYVIELKGDVADVPKFRRVNPDMNPALPCFYVGSTALTPEGRFATHKTDKRSAVLSRDYGVCLRPDLYSGIRPRKSRAKAEEREKRLAEDLRAKGHGVWQK